jgi:NAD(P)H-flavin reductase
VGDIVGVRGPFGTDWGLESLDGVDVVVVVGGVGLAPLRGAMRYLAEHKSPKRAVALRVGARLPDQIVFPDEIARWGEMGIDVAVTVDVADAGWTGNVGVVTQILAELPFDGAGAIALVCGPEIMMRFSARSLVDLGVAPENIRVSLERNMQCGIAMCGHCQLGPYLLCRDGPVVPYAPLAAELITESER